MAKHQYHFNEETLTFSQHKKSAKQILKTVFGYLATSTAIATAFVFVFYFFFDSPKEKKLIRENAELHVQYNIINKQMDDIAGILDDIQTRDDNIYRAVFESDPIPSTIRDAGFGGANRYQDLKSLDAAKLVIDTRMKLDIITKKLYVQSNSFDEVVELAKNKEKMLMCTPMIMPIATNDVKRIGSPFGVRIDPFTKVRKFHYGQDFTAATGTDVHVTGNGRVETAHYSYTYGNVVIVNHGYNYKSLYAHLSGLNVKKGQKVTRGQIIGFVGNTGRSRGAHLHYEVKYKGRQVDPRNHFLNDLTPEQYEEMLMKSEQYGLGMD